MKKSILIIALCACQAACSTQPMMVEQPAALLTFADLANEITVGYRDVSADAAAAGVDGVADSP